MEWDRTTRYGQRYYKSLKGDRDIPSVTTICNAYPKGDVLTNWAKKLVATSAMDMFLSGELDQFDDAEKAITHLKKIPDVVRDTAAQLGTDAHELIEYACRQDVIPTEKLTEKTTPFLDQFLLACDTYKIEPMVLEVQGEAHILAETTVFGYCGTPERQYAGTVDLWGYIDGVPAMIDHKTGNGVYESYSLQCAAYALASDMYLWINGEWVRFDPPQVDRVCILHVRPDYHNLYEITEIPEAFKVFKAAYTMFSHKKRQKFWKPQLVEVQEEVA